MPQELQDDAGILAEIIAAFNRLDPGARERIYDTVGAFFQLKKQALVSTALPTPSATPLPANVRPSFSADRVPSPKEFLMDKQPRTDVERVACLAYYLQQYREQAHFSTLDLSKLNTEAAQRKFANAAWAVANAVKMGYLVPAAKGARQLSAAGERAVQMLPDYEAAKAVMGGGRPRRNGNRNKRNSKSQA
jgi:hypothetical protein